MQSLGPQIRDSELEALRRVEESDFLKAHPDNFLWPVRFENYWPVAWNTALHLVSARNVFFTLKPKSLRRMT